MTPNQIASEHCLIQFWFSSDSVWFNADSVWFSAGWNFGNFQIQSSDFAWNIWIKKEKKLIQFWFSFGHFMNTNYSPNTNRIIFLLIIHESNNSFINYSKYDLNRISPIQIIHELNIVLRNYSSFCGGEQHLLLMP